MIPRGIPTWVLSLQGRLAPHVAPAPEKRGVGRGADRSNGFVQLLRAEEWKDVQTSSLRYCDATGGPR
jgi:hypothetical protein